MENQGYTEDYSNSDNTQTHTMEDIENKTSGGDGVKQEQEIKSTQCRSRSQSILQRVRLTITIEPVLILYTISFQASLAIQSQYVYRSLLNIYSNGTIPLDDAMSSIHDVTSPIQTVMSPVNGTKNPESCNEVKIGEVQIKAQSTAALMTIIFGPSTIIPALFSNVFLASYSDRAGRKWGMIPPVVGDMIKNAIIITSIIFKVSFWQPLMVGCLISGILGNFMLMVVTCMAYIADITTRKERMVRLVVIELLLGFADLTGNLVIGHSIAVLGFLYSYVVLFTLNTLSLLYMVFILKETVQRKPDARLCSFDNYRKAFHVYARGDVPGRRFTLLLALLIMVFFTMVEQGANGPSLDLYFMNIPLCWKSIALGYYRSFLVVVRFAFNVFAMKILLPRMKAGGLLILGCVSLIIYDLVLAQVVATWIAYTAATCSFGVIMVIAMLRGVASTKVDPHEQGALFSGQGISVLASGLAGTLMYNALYSKTVKTFSRTVFYIATGQGILTLGLSGILVRSLHKREKEEKASDENKMITDRTNDKDHQLTRF